MTRNSIDLLVTLADKSDAYNFILGTELGYTSAGLRRMTRLERFSSRLARLARRLTWWRESRVVAVAIDHEAGSVTFARMRWSWRRWKWVRET